MEKVEIKYDSINKKYLYPDKFLLPGITYALEAVSRYDPLLRPGVITTVTTRLANIQADLTGPKYLDVKSVHHKINTFIKTNDSIQWVATFEFIADPDSKITIETACNELIKQFNDLIGTDIPQFETIPVYFDSGMTNADEKQASIDIGESVPSTSWGGIFDSISNAFNNLLHLDTPTMYAIIGGIGFAILLKLRRR